MKGKINWGLLLSGMLANTHVNIGGSIGISELAFFLVAPFVFIADMEQLRKDGFLPVTLLALSVVAGCCVSSWCNHTPFPLFMKGFATTYSVFACIVVFHRLLRRDMDGVKWVVLGFAISQIINVFAFRQGAEGAFAARRAAGSGDLEVAKAMTNGTLFWVNRATHWLMLPIRGWYLTTPTWYSASVPFALSVYAIAFTGSGRAAAIGTLVGCAFVLIAGKSKNRMRGISKHFVMFITIMGIFLFAVKTAYTQMGRMGLLSEAQTKKFMEQTKGGASTSALYILMSGRVEFFSGLYAACKRPIVGYGPWPIDKDGIYYEFLEKYGDIEDWSNYENMRAEQWFSGHYTSLPSHSFIIEFWQWYGIPGLLFWIYILCQMFAYMRKYIYIVPQWFGFLAVGVPSVLWSIFFSPFGYRMYFAFFIVVLLFSRGISEGRIKLPEKMLFDINRYAR